MNRKTTKDTMREVLRPIAIGIGAAVLSGELAHAVHWADRCDPAVYYCAAGHPFIPGPHTETEAHGFAGVGGGRMMLVASGTAVFRA